MRVSSQAMMSTPARVSSARKRDVAEMADRGGHQVEPGNRLWGVQDMAADRKCPVHRTRFGFRPVAGTGFCAHNGNLERS